MEIWKDIQGFEGYQVSNLGRVRTHNKVTFTQKHGARHWKDRILKYKKENYSSKNKKQGIGFRVDLWKNGKPHTFLVHRLVAATFLENLLETNMTVNHKDGNRYNNDLENLEWLSRKENIQYGFTHNQYPQKEVQIKNQTTNETKSFKSLAEASKYYKKSKGYVSYLIINKRKTFTSNNIVYEIL